MSSAPKSASVPEPIVSDVRKPSLCLPDAWLRFFDDLRLVAVLKAHADAESAPDAFIALTEMQCAERTRLHRETVHKKKRELIDRYRVLCPQPGSGRGWRGLPCRIDHERLRQLVENSADCRKTNNQMPENQQLIVGKPTIENTPTAGKPTIERSENQQLIAGKPTIETPPYKERAPAPASFDLASLGSKLASDEPQAKAEESVALEEAITDAIRRSRLKEIQGAELNEFTIPTLRKALKPIAHDEAAVKIELDRIERKCEYVRRHPDSAESWGVLVAMVRADVKTFLKDAAPERKPPQKEKWDVADEWLQAFPQHPQAKAAKA